LGTQTPVRAAKRGPIVPEARRIALVIDRTYPLSEVPAAIRHLEEGHARCKIVITV